MLRQTPKAEQRDEPTTMAKKHGQPDDLRQGGPDRRDAGALHQPAPGAAAALHQRSLSPPSAIATSPGTAFPCLERDVVRGFRPREDTRWSHEAAKEAIGEPSRLPVRHGGAPTPTNRARATWLRPRRRGWIRGLSSDHPAGFTILAGYPSGACYQGPKGWSRFVA
jgi:hypothetical protein